MNLRRPSSRSSRPLVLIVDHDDDTRDMYVDSLAALGFRAVAAADGAQARRRAWESHPDIVVTDVSLPGVDGWQLIRDLKREARTRDIPVVLVTGIALPSLRQRAKREGCAAFFVKPCLPDQLALQLRRVLEGMSLVPQRRP